MKNLIKAILLAVLVFTGCNKNNTTENKRLPEANKLVVYTSHKPEVFEPIIKEFEERSGIWVQVRQGGTNELLEQISSSHHNSGADIMFGGGVDSLMAYQDCFSSYRTNKSRKLDRKYVSATDSYTVFSKLPIVFIYNKRLLTGAEAPQTFRELLDPRWKGLIAFADPSTSGSAYTALATMIQLLHKNYPDEKIIKDFTDNLDGDICRDSAYVLDEVIYGKKFVGITLEETALKRISNGADIGIIYPADGTSTVPDGCAVLKNAPHVQNAHLFIEFIVSDAVQQFLQDQLYRRSVRTDIESFQPVTEMRYDVDYAINKREEILSEWNRVAGNR